MLTTKLSPLASLLFVPLVMTASLNDCFGREPIRDEAAGGGDPMVAGQCTDSSGQPVHVGGIGEWRPEPDLASYEGSEPTDDGDTGPFTVQGGRVDHCSAVGAASGMRRCCCTVVTTADGEVTAEGAAACTGRAHTSGSVDCSNPEAAETLSLSTDAEIDECLRTQTFGPAEPGDFADDLVVAGPGSVDWLGCDASGSLIGSQGVRQLLDLPESVVRRPTAAQADQFARAPSAGAIAGSFIVRLPYPSTMCVAAFLRIAVRVAPHVPRVARGLRIMVEALKAQQTAPYADVEERDGYPEARGVLSAANNAIDAVRASQGCRSNHKRNLVDRLHGMYYTSTNRGEHPPNDAARLLVEAIRALLNDPSCRVDCNTLSDAARAFRDYLETFEVRNPNGVLAQALATLNAFIDADGRCGG